MNLHLEFNSTIIILNSLLRVIAGAIALFTVIPLVYKEATVKNGLRTLRLQFMATNTLLFFIIMQGFAVILLRPVLSNEALQTVTAFITTLTSIELLIIVIIKNRVYHQSYTPEQKKIHEKLAVLEEKKRKRVRKNK